MSVRLISIRSVVRARLGPLIKVDASTCAQGLANCSIVHGPSSRCPNANYTNIHCLIAHWSIVPLSIVPRSDCLIIRLSIVTLSIVHVSIVHFSTVPLSNVPLSHCSFAPLSQFPQVPASHCKLSPWHVLSSSSLAILCCNLLFYPTTQDPAHRTNIALGNLGAAIAQLGERQAEDLKVPGSTPGLGIYLLSACAVRRERRSQSLERATSLNFFVRLTPARSANLHRR